MIELLMPVRLSDQVCETLAASFKLHRLWEAADEAAFLASVAPRIRGIVTGAGILSDGRALRIDGPFMAQFPALELVFNLGVGYDTIDAAWAAEHGIVVTNTPDVLTEETADTAMGLLLNTVRQFPAAERWLREGRWEKAPFPLSATLRGRTLGILGLGRIGKAIAKRAEAFGVAIAYCGRHKQDDVSFPYYATPLELAAASDILLVAAPGGPQTRNLVDRAVLEALGPQGVLINIARGSLVDQVALIEALQTGAIASAGLDVFTHEPHVPAELIALDHVVLFPHIGSATHETRRAMARLLIDNIEAWASGKPPLTPVPESRLARTKQR
jgi:lactate dehydrogenase-like 2-hydroxyacid dehydrogenase